MPDINRKELAARYGWSLALLNSSPELKKLFDKAVKGTWTPEKFVAQLRSTKWFKKNGESARQAITLKTTDPGTYNERMKQRMAAVRTLAIEVGAGLSTAQLKDIASDSFLLGWDDNQIKRSLTDYIRRAKDGHLSGAAFAADQQIRQYAYSMGVPVAAKRRDDWAAAIATGRQSIEDIQSRILTSAQSRYPHLADALKGGQTLQELAEPYRQSIAQILEINANSIPLTDRRVQKGLSARTDDGKPYQMPLWQYEDDLRTDPQWRKTDNAKEAADSLTHKLLTDFGFLT